MGQSHHRCQGAGGKATGGLCIAQTFIPACAPAQDTFQLDVSETHQKSFIRTVLNEKLTFAKRNSLAVLLFVKKLMVFLMKNRSQAGISGYVQLKIIVDKDRPFFFFFF